MIVVVLSVTPEKLRGELTRWLLEISTGTYIGNLSARVRERLWLRIIEDVGSGRAIMVWSTRNEQRLAFRVHNHSWEPVNYDGLTLMRRQTAESLQLKKTKRHVNNDRNGRTAEKGVSDISYAEGARDNLGEPVSSGSSSRDGWSIISRRRHYGSGVERRRRSQRPAEESE
jgi:CRISPR-associated protein Cas2